MQASLLKRWLLGAPKPTSRARHERRSKALALPVFSSDALSSVALRDRGDPAVHGARRRLVIDGGYTLW